MSHFKKNWKIRMSTMTEQDFQNDIVQAQQMQHMQNAAVAAAAAHAQQMIDNAKLPLSPSATSTASSSSSSNYATHKSSSSSSSSSANAAAAAAAAAIALLSDQHNMAHHHHYQHQMNANQLLSHKDIAKMNLDPNNFKMDHHFNTIANVASQLQQHLCKQERHDYLDNGENHQLLLTAVNGSKANGTGKTGANHLHHHHQHQKPNKHRSRRSAPPMCKSESSLQDDDDDCGSDEYNDDDDNEDNDITQGGQHHSLNLCLNQRKRNGALIKGNSLSPSPRGTSCSEETHSPLKSSSYGSSKKNSRSSQSDMHSDQEEEEHEEDRSLTPNSSRSMSPTKSEADDFHRDINNTTITSPYGATANVHDASMLAQMQAAGLGVATQNGTLNTDTLNNLSAAITANAAAQLPITSTVATILASRKRRNERDSNERNKKIKPVPNEKKDDQYWERRRKNNEAAKRSRDLRRQKEDEIAVRAAFLEQENLKLRAQVTILKTELSKLHFMIYNR